MSIQMNQQAIDEIYRIYQQFIVNIPTACKKGCSACCTGNVTVCTAETHAIANHLLSTNRQDLCDRLNIASRVKRFHPKMTTNQLAEMCIRGEEPFDEENDASWGTCPLLVDGECAVYPFRPFGCRCFVSDQTCTEKGFANVDPFVVTVNTVFLQFIEHMDQNGYTANLTDALLYRLAQDEGTGAVSSSKRPTERFIPNRPIRFLLVPPKHREKIHPIVEQLQNVGLKYGI